MLKLIKRSYRFWYSIYTHVSFLVTETGKISDVKASGNNESLNLATILAIYDLNQGFVPAKYKGKKIWLL